MRSSISFLIVLLVVSSCNQERKTTKTLEDQQKVNSTIQELLKADPEKVALLSMKYSIRESQISAILRRYKEKHDFTHKLIASVLRDEADSLKNFQQDATFVATIDELSKVYSLPPQHVASVIIDFKIWTACEEPASASN